MLQASLVLFVCTLSATLAVPTVVVLDQHNDNKEKEKNLPPLSGGVFFVPKTNVPGFRP
jgi:hypothetical protein